MANTSLVGGVPDDTFISRAEQAAQLAEEAAAAAAAAQAAAEQALADTLAALAAQLIEDHADTTIAGKATGDVLYYNGSAWVNQQYVMDNLTDVTAPAPNNDDVLAWNGSAWVPVTAASISGAVSIAGDTMTGLLTLSGVPTDPLHAATKAYVDGIPASTPLYILSTFTTNAPQADEMIMAHIVTDSFTLPIDLTDSQVESKVAATAQTDFDIQINQVSVGTIRFAAAATVATFIFTSLQSLVQGDEIEIIAPSTPDATLARLRISLRGLR